jgi:UDP-3-O-[3-hydroxymyristoyl] glucosamine N-acyltransferase
VAGHLKIGNQVTIGSKSGVMRDIADKQTVLGFPAAPHTQAKRQWLGIQRLPDIQLQLRDLQKQVTALKAQLD